MKPRYRPGKPAAAEPNQRKGIAKAKQVTANQLEHLKQEHNSSSIGKKAGRGGKRADWNVDYEEEHVLSSEPMPYREPEKYTQDGLHRFPKRGGHQ